MGGGLIQLVAYGAQDVYITGNPQITFFKTVYRRHTNFSCEAVEQTFNGDVAFNGRASCQITRNGDLVGKMYLKATLKKERGSKLVYDADPYDAGDYDATLYGATSYTGEGDLGQWVKNVGKAMIKNVELLIGGTMIDKQYGLWMTIWDELSSSGDLDSSRNTVLGNELYSKPSGAVWDGSTDGTVNLFVPLQFFCCRNNGLALPLIALQYHDVRVDIEFNTADYCTKADFSGETAIDARIDRASLLVDYVYLDSEERKRFAQSSHEYLIEQIQYAGEDVYDSGVNKFRLNFNHPCKELIWSLKEDSSEHSEFSKDAINAKLRVNGHERMSQQPGLYFNKLQTLQHHSRTPSEGIYVYSFSLNPEKHQPSGTCNFSRIDNVELEVNSESSSGNIHIYGLNYNVLRIMSGMGGLAYSN